jgi:hypothetical protein
MQGELLVSLEFVLCSFADGVEPFCLPSRTRCCELFCFDCVESLPLP